MLAEKFWCEVWKNILFYRGSKFQIFSYDRSRPIDFETDRNTKAAECFACPSGSYQRSGEALHYLRSLNFIFQYRGYERTHLQKSFLVSTSKCFKGGVMLSEENTWTNPVDVFYKILLQDYKIYKILGAIDYIMEWRCKWNLTHRDVVLLHYLWRETVWLAQMRDQK